MRLLANIKTVYTNIILLGSDKVSEDKRKTLKLLNIFGLLWIHGSLVFLLIDTIRTGSFSNGFFLHTVITLLTVCIVIYLNVNKYQEAAKVLFLGVTLTHALYFSVEVMPNRLVELLTLGIPLGAVVLFKRFWAHFLVFVVSLTATLLSHLVFQDYPLPNVVAFIYALPYCVSYLIVVYLNKLNQEQEALLIRETEQAVSDRKLIEQQAQQLKELDDFKNKFFVNISHEIRTPLTLISGYSKKLTNSDTYSEQQQYANIIAEQSANIKQLTDSIIDLGKLEDGHIKLNITLINFSSMLRGIHADFEGMFSEKSIAWQLQLPEEDVYLNCDTVMMQRALNNLVTNALKFTPEQGSATIRLTHDPNIKLTITNTGIGIPPDDLGRIFERYYQSPNHITDSQGSGVGLAFTKGVLEAHGFSIIARSEHHKYASFIITVPSQRLPEQGMEFYKSFTANGKSLEAEAYKSRSLNAAKNILVVEDNPAMRKYILEIEALRGFQLHSVENGLEALDMIKSHAIDLIITDYMMPYMDGPALVSQLKNIGFQKPIIVLTARTDPQSKLDMLRLGIDSFLTKPFLEEELVNTVEKALAHNNAREEFIEQAAEKNETLTADGDLITFNRLLTRLIDDNISNADFDVSDLCEQLHMTERTLYRKTKELCGSTPAKLITERRLLSARTLYEQKKYKSVRQLSLSVGFTNSTRFSQKFYDRFGIRP